MREAFAGEKGIDWAAMSAKPAPTTTDAKAGAAKLQD
jgi:hypothetical protein